MANTAASGTVTVYVTASVVPPTVIVAVTTTVASPAPFIGLTTTPVVLLITASVSELHTIVAP